MYQAWSPGTISLDDRLRILAARVVRVRIDRMLISQPFVLLDDVLAAPGMATSRLYTEPVGEVTCATPEQLDELDAKLHAAWEDGHHAVLLAPYEFGERLVLPSAVSSNGRQSAAPVAFHDGMLRVLLFRKIRSLDSRQVEDWLRSVSLTNGHPGGNCGQSGSVAVAGVRSSIDAPTFIQAVQRIQDLLAAGDSYQVNFTYRLTFDLLGDPVLLYAALRRAQPVSYGALMRLVDGGTVLSLSPEAFVAHDGGGRLRARPMKGTASVPPASADESQTNAALALAMRLLAEDEKNRAENLMIVDLLRNDLGRLASPGSVRVPALFEVQRFGEVLQMTSTIEAQATPDVGIAALLRALFPSGSITGAPKRRSMEILRELESCPRGLYTGAIGWIDPPEQKGGLPRCSLSVAIRTLVLAPPNAPGSAPLVCQGEMGVGAGIVIDSHAEDELRECRLKSSFLTNFDPGFTLIETIKANRERGCLLLERHLARLRTSAKYFGFALDEADIRARVEAACGELGPGDFRLRLDLHKSGQLEIRLAPLPELVLTNGAVSILIAPEAVRVESSDPFRLHKTSQRRAYDALWQSAEQRGAFDTLTFNERDELTEGGRSNVFVRLNGQWLTPSLSSGVLPGVMRSVLLSSPDWAAKETVIRRSDLSGVTEWLVCNALRGVVPARLVA